MSIHIVLADDHRMLREALRSVLAPEPDIEVVGEAGTAQSTLDAVARFSPDVLVLDVEMPGFSGIEVARRIRANASAARIVALSGHSEKRVVQDMLSAGAQAYVTKSAGGAELVSAIRAVARGESFLCREAARALTGVQRPHAASSGSGAPPASLLGRREREVLMLLAEGKRSAAIASRLGISTATVEAHRRNLMRKLGLHGIAALTKYAIREGLVSL